VSGRDEVGRLAASFQTMAEGLRGMVADLGSVASQLEGEGHLILESVARQASMAAQQAAAINETSTTAAEIAQTSKQATEHADRVIEVAQKSEDLSVDGKRVVEDAVAAMLSLGDQVKATAAVMSELSRKSEQIGDVVATVRDVAEQTNVLALNAAIEASRAGEHGKGFSVVALEMRNLAEQSKGAAAQVKAMLAELDKGAHEALRAAGEGEKRAQGAIELARTAGAAIEGLAETIRESSLAARQIANNTRQQTVGVEQIVTAINQVSSAMSDAVEGSRRIEKGTGNLNALSKRLMQAVTRYRV
jgi:methyl-accepting chemotaxis protein